MSLFVLIGTINSALIALVAIATLPGVPAWFHYLVVAVVIVWAVAMTGFYIWFSATESASRKPL